MRARQLHTVEEVISELGGPKAVQELVNLASDSAVRNWPLRGSFPPRTYAIMKSELRARGATAPDDLWNMVGADGASP